MPLFFSLSNTFQPKEKAMSHTIILRHQGIDRTYHCQNKFDAIVLFDALSRIGGTVEMWDGATLVQQYN